jgi:hypothetical protein
MDSYVSFVGRQLRTNATGLFVNGLCLYLAGRLYYDKLDYHVRAPPTTSGTHAGTPQANPTLVWLRGDGTWRRQLPSLIFILPPPSRSLGTARPTPRPNPKRSVRRPAQAGTAELNASLEEVRQARDKSQKELGELRIKVGQLTPHSVILLAYWCWHQPWRGGE